MHTVLILFSENMNLDHRGVKTRNYKQYQELYQYVMNEKNAALSPLCCRAISDSYTFQDEQARASAAAAGGHIRSESSLFHISVPPSMQGWGVTALL